MFDFVREYIFVGRGGYLMCVMTEYTRYLRWHLWASWEAESSALPAVMTVRVRVLRPRREDRGFWSACAPVRALAIFTMNDYFFHRVCSELPYNFHPTTSSFRDHAGIYSMTWTGIFVSPICTMHEGSSDDTIAFVGSCYRI